MKLKVKVDTLKVLKLIIIHGLAEAVTGDIPAFEVSTRQLGKHETEKKALSFLTNTFPKKSAKEINKLWEEFEKCETKEAQFANALDKIEVLIQHNIADIKTWSQGDYDIGPYYKDHFLNFDLFMRSFKDYVDIDTMKKIIKAKQESRINPKHIITYREKNRT
jgi:putative hydrolases of HD superfamily